MEARSGSRVVRSTEKGLGMNQAVIFKFAWRLAIASLFGALFATLPFTQGLVGAVFQAREAPPAAAENSLVVHEWGTFTSIAGEDGAALEWRPLNGASDLPNFVYQIQNGAQKGLRHNTQTKYTMEAFIRMETPVLYFYADRETVVSAKVDFPSGKITEWYPQ